ncbi:hypothetical protein SAMN03159290_03886 [Pseudomonas sp. NFACC13-1]|nr:hypothetical protein SAMN03159290_03886 [Pseudomonas sp. NFACC13-1]
MGPNYPVVTASYRPPQSFDRKLSVNLDINIVDLLARFPSLIGKAAPCSAFPTSSLRRRGMGTMPPLRREPTRPKAASGPPAMKNMHLPQRQPLPDDSQLI